MSKKTPKEAAVFTAEGLKPKDVAAITSININTVHNLMKDPRGIRSFQLGHRLLTTRAEVNRFLVECVAGGVSVPDVIAPVPVYKSASKIDGKRLKEIQKRKKFEYIL